MFKITFKPKASVIDVQTRRRLDMRHAHTLKAKTVSAQPLPNAFGAARIQCTTAGNHHPVAAFLQFVQKPLRPVDGRVFGLGPGPSARKGV